VHVRTYNYRHAESILNANFRLKKEIERILEQLQLETSAPARRMETCSLHRQIQRAFLRRQWQGEVLVSPRTAHRHRFDVYKERVAVEIELSHRERLYRDYLRFVMAEAEDRIDLGMIIVLDENAPAGNGSKWGGVPRLEDVEDDLKMLHAAITVPIWVVALS